MPLSEQEQRLLDEMERHLMQNDADVVSAPAGAQALSYRNLIIGAILVLAGLGAVIAGITLWRTSLVLGLVVGVIGFAAMLGGVILALAPVKGGSVARPAARGGASRAPRQASFMDRMNERWERRQNGDG
jgi:predicted phage tail protein